MPADITGTDIIETDPAGRRSFRFLRGPVFCNLLLADEINRTPPKTQAAMLQVMQEREVTVGDVTHKLPEPFFVPTVIEKSLTILFMELLVDFVVARRWPKQSPPLPPIASTPTEPELVGIEAFGALALRQRPCDAPQRLGAGLRHLDQAGPLLEVIDAQRR